MKRSSHGSRISVLSEVGSVFALSIVVLWIWPATSMGKALSVWQNQRLYWNYFSHVFFIVLALSAILAGRRSFRAYGLSREGWRFGVKWGLILALILDATLLLAALLAGGLKKPSHALSTVVFQLFLVGFSEEVLYRGYFQSRLNEAFEKKFSFRGFDFGWGLILTAILFGFAHLLNPFNPLAGRLSLDSTMGATSAVYGFFFGLMREKTGSILMPAIVHGANFVYYLFPASTMGFPAAWLINGVLLFRVLPGAKSTGRQS